VKEFDFNTIDDFDEHIRLSIPNYEFLISQVKMYIDAFAESNCPVVDVGCSTGSLIASIDASEDIQFYGIDESILIDNAIATNESINKHFEQVDFFEWDMPKDCSVVCSVFFLQFLGYKERKTALKKMTKHLIEGGRLIVCEKTYFHDSRIEHIVSANYLEEKRANFSDKDILDKNTKLGNSMKLKTDRELITELSAYGDVTVFFKSLGFTGCIVRVK